MPADWTIAAEDLDLALQARGRRERRALAAQLLGAALVLGLGLAASEAWVAGAGAVALAALVVPGLGMSAFERALRGGMITRAEYRAELRWQARLLRAVPAWYVAPLAVAQAVVLSVAVLVAHTVAPALDLLTGLVAGALALHRARAWAGVVRENRLAADQLAHEAAALPPVQ